MADLTQLRVLIEMGLLVGGQIAGLGEPLIAVRIGTNVGFLTRVCAQMRSQVEVKGEAFAAKCALKRLLARMHKLMAL